MPGIAQEDRELAAAAKKKAGGVAALARHFDVSKQAASGWGRRHPIPRHLRERVKEYVNGAVASTPAATPEDVLARLRAHPELLDHVVRQIDHLEKIPALMTQIAELLARIQGLETELAAASDPVEVVRARHGAQAAREVARAIATAARAQGRAGGASR